MGLPVTMVVLGAGARGRTLAGYAADFPGQARVVAVAEPDPQRRDRLSAEHTVPPAARFADWRELAARPRLADAVLVTTPDREHAGPARAFAGLGYDVLLEKPIAPTEAECTDLVEAVEAAGVVFGVCHVMRYSPYTATVEDVAASGVLGEIVGIEHAEPVGWWHFAHSYVRGNWRRSDASGPSLLTKCCHDLDWLRHIVGRPALRVSSAGGLHHFTAASRPAGAADRCLDCPLEPDCPYSAVRLYLGFLTDPKRREWPLPVLTPLLTEAGVRKALREGPYGRCVYACDNDVADHQVVIIEFAGGVTASLTMSAFTPMGRRRTAIMGTRGFLAGDGHQVTVTDFSTGRVRTVSPAPALGAGPGGGHGGGDYGLMAAFTNAVATGDRSQIRSGARESLQSHLMAFAAERSRLSGCAEPVPS
ncbi:MAG TPA: Gfo/Idh/MocA family oxidoreductase [Streptosporangiaceae bacterium]|jgi:predicted dehydrogenase|nr:Gfo/Idh/MocA family oxidoreductase [Streptosporangiaceae bacterium]